MRHTIAVTGAQGVGKTTLVREVALALTEVRKEPIHIHVGIGAEVRTLGLPLGENANNSTLLEFARIHTRRERLLGDGIHIIDRCLVDLLAYSQSIGGGCDRLIELISEMVYASTARMDLIVYVPLIPSLFDKNPSHESPTFRSQIDRAIREIMPSINTAWLEVSGDNQERVEQVMNSFQLR